VDLFVRDGQVDFQDAAGVGKAAERASLSARIDELDKRIRAWEQNPSIPRADVEARQADRRRLTEDLRKLENPPPPSQGSFFRYSNQEIRSELGQNDAVKNAMLAYYKQVNEHNKVAFAGRTPPPPGPDGTTYIGAEACGVCHAAAREVWKKTDHGHAYKTLSDQHKEYNLDCVSCHVTGYGKPGGSTVTVNDTLRDVQCEECHGPGSRHRENPTDKGRIVASPPPEGCVSSCHHPPHVEGFDPVAQMHRILGPGHGKVESWPPLKPR
jgi:hypothetical protein